ncbi:FkbM family methyltransferase [Aeromicrobium sp. 50.2.37]|uniref:FkbM family methyltransferase n=1 Tax=Aeromicrobium sp. 50.2.37 TaxID=2969305 RepID=UPI002150288A|nr:FkbM family methyltransferase [Aeromicrobium sp. 50.2.37]MCR4514752.1 FkbM family methyltransferase [Aeromicrobium sp. 50.2.37]
MSDQTLTNRVRETAKLALRRALQRADLEIGRGSYASRLAATLRSRGIDTVVDVGSNVGQFSTLLRSAGYAGTIHGYEPLSGAYAELAARAAKDPRWTVHHAAVGAAPGSLTINVSANSFSSSIRPMTDAHRTAAPGSDYVASEPVDVTTVALLVQEHGIVPERSLLKIDTQGFEDEVLQGAGDLVGRFAAIQLELSFVELYAGQRLHDELVRDLQAAGYRLQQLDPGFSDQDGRLLQVDGLFVLTSHDR